MCAVHRLKTIIWHKPFDTNQLICASFRNNISNALFFQINPRFLALNVTCVWWTECFQIITKITIIIKIIVCILAIEHAFVRCLILVSGQIGAQNAIMQKRRKKKRKKNWTKFEFTFCMWIKFYVLHFILCSINQKL